MRTIIQVLFVVVFAALVGGHSAWRALGDELFSNVLRIGPWQALVPSRTGDVPPYERAKLALLTQAQLGFGEGLRFVAKTDSQGEPLHSRCRYRMEGPAPKARVFTIYATDLDGNWYQMPKGSFDFLHSQMVDYDAANNISVHIGPNMSFDDWLLLPADKPFLLIYSLYDTAIGAVSDTSQIELPKIKRIGCQA